MHGPDEFMLRRQRDTGLYANEHCAIAHTHKMDRQKPGDSDPFHFKIGGARDRVNLIVRTANKKVVDNCKPLIILDFSIKQTHLN